MPQKYRCPGCGKMVRFGKHFCSGELESRLDDPFSTRTQSSGFQTFKKVAIILVASAMILALLWSTIGFFAYILIGVIAIIVAAVLLLQGGVSKSGGAAGSSAKRSDYHRLLRMLNGDSKAAERLIDTEMTRYPEFTRQDCIRRVHDKLEYDRSR